ncbi:hypothetical protein ACJJIQ_10785 [Microbulbifer sp. ANSA003]|uniref:hypothetical protein n=1 Tax=Microbulbifer sp. ANSA003 TaxID=3243360 RepID=UPI0040414917
MDNFYGFSIDEIEERVIEPHGGLDCFVLVRFPGYKIPRYILDGGLQMDLVVEEDNLNDATVAYLEYKGVKEIDWR